MHKGLMAGLAVAGVLGAGTISGYFYIEDQVHAAVQTAFTETLPALPIVESAGYDSYDVDLLGNTASFQNVRMVMDLAALPEQLETLPPGVSLAGDFNMAYETVVVKGIWALVLGGQKVEHIDVGASKLSGTMIQTIEKPDTVQVDGKEYVGEDNPVQRATISMRMNGTLGGGTVDGLDLSTLQDPAVMSHMNLGADRYAFENMIISMTAETQIEAPSTAPDGASPMPRTLPAFDMEMAVARMVGENISPTYYGLASYENATVIIIPKEDGDTPLRFKIGEMRMSDTKMVNYQPVRMTMELKDMVFDSAQITEPRALAVMGILGIDDINLNMKVSYDYDVAQQTLKLQPLRLGLKQAGSAEVAFNLVNVPDLQVFQDIQGMQGEPEKIKATLENAFKDIALDEVALGYTDDGVLKKFLALQAGQMNATPEQMAQAFAAQGAQIVGAALGDVEAAATQEVLAQFLSDPDAIRIQLKAKLPVKIEELVQDIQVHGPGALKNFQFDITGGAAASH